ncbi:Sugar phosphate isomerase/epimerase [Catalinimonas alkaloidigena]|uniref:Sugar phosphate isomerase/epimerase n=1 Tax=Catalinimonas alkaloidigena TaxID=1075417 RepID=A0A1G9VSK3_9BACT|nr:sugar phosphate isomerase/epimerase family protein [Catalinimonas alkaloidigena]SDM74845.1 Sugar phosphate isomerase/epimerase [Catalinimonas alkaloidigena]
MQNNRRRFLKQAAQASLGLGALASLPLSSFSMARPQELFFDISLAEWSLHKALFAGKMTNLDFPAKAKQSFDISAVEYVSVFFDKKEKEQSYLRDLKKRCDDLGVRSVLIMVDREGYLADRDKAKRMEAVQNHHKWVDAAKFLGCHSIRVNAHGEGTADEVKQAAVEGLGTLAEYGAKNGINIIVENHGGYSSNGAWLADVMKQVNNPNCGTLPDFGNFRLSETEEYDKYKGVKEMMPYAKGVSAKAYEFDANGNEPKIDFRKMMQLVKDAGYTGYVGIEYEGSQLSEEAGIRATKQLLEKVGAELS